MITLLLADEEPQCSLDNPPSPPIGEGTSLEVIDGRLYSIDLRTLFFDLNCDSLVFEIVDDGGIALAIVFDQELNFSSLFGSGSYQIRLKATDPNGESGFATITVTLQ